MQASAPGQINPHESTQPLGPDGPGQVAGAASSMLQLATRLGRLGAWAIDVPQMTVTWSPEVMAIHEMQGQPQPTVAQLEELLHPDWRATVSGAIRLCVVQGRPFELEIRARTARLRTLWLNLIGEAVRDPAGRVVRVQGAVQDITEKKEAADRFRELSEQLSTTLESVTDAFFTLDRSWRFTYVNHEAERLLARGRQELLGQVVWEEFPSEVGNVFHREYERALAQSCTVRFQARSVAIDRWLQVVAYPSLQGLAVYFRDVTESRDAHQALSDSEERYRLLFETSVDAILQTSPQGRIVRANQAACTMFGMSLAQMLGLDRGRLVAPQESWLDDATDQRPRTGKATSQLTMLRADGSRFEVEATSSQSLTQDGSLLTHIILRDISERLRFQQEILQLNTELGERVRRRTEELELANRELKGFAHSLAHDLRAPIATIKGFGATLQESLAADGTSREQHYLRRIQAAADRMDEYVEALLSLANLTQARLHITEVDLTAMASAILADLGERHPGRGVKTRVQHGLRAAGDARLLRMALENLLGNAWKFTSRREAAEISFTAAADPQSGLVYSVRDNGAGFDMAYVQKLFGNFQRLHRESEFPGTGIGLSNVQRIVLRHGGRVWAESVEDQGATFSFVLGQLTG